MSVATSYARALFESAQDKKASAQDIEKLETDLDTVAALVSSSKDLRAVLVGPALSSRQKAELVEKIAPSLKISQLLTQFMVLMARKERLGLLPQIREAFSAVRLEAEGGIAGKVVSAEPLERADLEGLAQAFGKKLGKRISFRTSTDPSLLAGVKVVVNGVTYDGTLKAQLQRLRDRMVYGASASQ